MITTITMTLGGLPVPASPPCYEPVMGSLHARKPWPGVVVLGGVRFIDNSTRVSADRGRLE